MSQTHPYRWALAFGWLVGLAFVALALWLYRLQVIKHDHYREIVKRMHEERTVRAARRGDILDRRGVVLATSLPVRTICADPALIFTQRVAVARTIAPLLGLEATDVLAKLTPVLRTNAAGDVVTNRFAVLKRGVPLEVWEQVRSAMANFDLGLTAPKKSGLDYAITALKRRAIYAQEGYVRQYPEGTLASHVIGYTSSGEIITDFGTVFAEHGETGVEAVLEELLAGALGWKGNGGDLPPRPGLNVVLTLDARVQRIVEEHLARGREQFDAASVFAVIVRPATGEILAMANAPALDPAAPGRVPDAHVNHLVGSLFEPGSTFKIVTLAAALEAGLLRLDERVNCHNGRWFYGGRYLHDHKGYGLLTFEEVLVKSSNIGTAQAALRLGPERLYHAITNFGFGRRTQIMLPGERAGVISHPREWSGLSITRIPIGHEVMATPLQMAMALAAFGNGGMLMRPMLVDRLEDHAGRLLVRYSPVAERRVLNEATAAAMLRALRGVASEEGTARKAELERHSLASKTGTTEKFHAGTYKSGKYYASFYALVPAEKPELCFLVGVNEPKRISHMGGATAGVIIKDIAEEVLRCLQIPPDLPGELTPASRHPASPETPATAAPRKTYAGHEGVAVPTLASR